MRVTCPVNTLDVLLKQCYIASRRQRLPARRAYATAATSAQAQNEVEEVAVLGGGITGLASAWYISKELPHARITLYEGRHRLGGWLHSKQVDVGGSKVVFEQGPRTLRPSIPNGMVTLELVGLRCAITTVINKYITDTRTRLGRSSHHDLQEFRRSAESFYLLPGSFGADAWAGNPPLAKSCFSLH